MIRFRSITARIIALHVLAIAAASIFIPVSLFLELRAVANDLQQRSLMDNANTIARYLSHEGDDFHLDLPEALRLVYSQTYGRYAFVIVDARGQTLFSSPPASAPIVKPNPSLGEPTFFSIYRGLKPLYGGSFPKKYGNQTIWVQVVEDLSHRDVIIDDVVRDFFQRVGWIVIPVLLSLLAFDMWVLRDALKPLFVVSAQAERISPVHIDIRFRVEEMPKEIRPVLRAVNQALDRLSEGYKAQREFTADAAHELRTPLAVLRMRVDALADREAAAALRADLDGMSRILSQLLQMAELEAFEIGDEERADLGGVAAKVAELVAPLALAAGKDVSLSRPDSPVLIAGNGEMVQRALRNLVDNALRYTPKGTTVEIEVKPDGRILVLDRGPGISEEDLDKIFHRFWRKDRKNGGGAGLGLAIVQRITEAHGGAVTMKKRLIGGTEASLSFPPIDPPMETF